MNDSHESRISGVSLPIFLIEYKQEEVSKFLKKWKSKWLYVTVIFLNHDEVQKECLQYNHGRVPKYLT